MINDNMGFFQNIFKRKDTTHDPVNNPQPSAANATALLVRLGTVTIGHDFITVANYPFEPAVVYRDPVINAAHITDLNLTSYPPTLRVGNELIFLTAEKKTELGKFAERNNIPIVTRPMLWEWILEPFLDTEYTDETNERLSQLLAEHGLTPDYVDSLRKEVGPQMYAYNFDTLLWEWVMLDASDVLRAMRVKYNQEQFREFYWKVMRIALLDPLAGQRLDDTDHA